MSDHAVVIGYGNELRGDDGVGPYVARWIADRRLPGVHALAVHQLTPELAADLAHARLAVFVDARAGRDGEPVEVATLEPGGDGPALTHTCHPRGLLALAQLLYGSAPDAWLVTIAGESFGLAEGLSESARCHADAAAEQIASLLCTMRLAPQGAG